MKMNKKQKRPQPTFANQVYTPYPLNQPVFLASVGSREGQDATLKMQSSGCSNPLGDIFFFFFLFFLLHFYFNAPAHNLIINSPPEAFYLFFASP